ncbi:hypothetical protein B0T22DRAFT_540227 [Podospora appendiculata]|uniref:Rhodopsin domain-containing protein n=1 Tax=Podospora appendiculata TaxID=314037 RepID=A0AAE1C7D1_9PEZI|nr:hypothetical protein B0T22DRAFT_540227 [Podospora appendiculata]
MAPGPPDLSGPSPPGLGGGDVDLSLLDHSSAGPELLGVTWALLVAAAAFLALRIYCKHIGHRGLWWDDWLLIASWVAHLIDSSLLSAMVARRYGHHPWDDGPIIGQSSSFMILMMTRTTFTITAAAWSKTAFAITMLRIGEGWMRWFLWFIIVSLNVSMGLNAMISWVGCSPVQKSWDMTVQGTCLDLSVIVNIGYVSGGYSAACDFILALLPWPIIWKLQMRNKEKIGVGIAMSMGIVAGIMSSIKTSQLNRLATGDSYDAAHLSIWDTTEIAVTIMAASIPTMRVLFKDARSSARRYYLKTDEHSGVNGPGNAGGSKYESHSTVIKSDRGGNDGSDSDRGMILAMSSTGRIYRVDEIDIESRSATGVEAYEMHTPAPAAKQG